MRNHLRIYSGAAVLLAGAAALCSGPASSQFGPQNPQVIEDAKKAPTPRTPDGHPDLTGNWGGGGSGILAVVLHGAPEVSSDGKKITLQLNPIEVQNKVDASLAARKDQADAANFPPYKPDVTAKVDALGNDRLRNDPTFECKPLGVPRMGAPTEIMEVPGAIALLYANRNVYRVVPTDGRPHNKDADAMADGDAVGHWEGDTLVVDVSNFSDDTWMGEAGYVHSPAMHVVERLAREGNTLTYAATVEDPGVLTKPWVIRPRILLLGKPGEHVGEDYPCEEKDQSHLVNGNHH